MAASPPLAQTEPLFPSLSISLASAKARERFALSGLLIGTAILYLWNLGASGWGNAFYSAAVQAGSSNLKAAFFGSFDASNFITVDKPPASLWLMEISARMFGVNAWSILVPEALEGVAAVAILYFAVRRVAGHYAGLLAGAVLALTPVAALMFRYNNPDALLTLELVAAGYFMIRAHEDGRTRWLLFAGCLIGFGFLTKMLQAFIVLPGFSAVYFVLGPGALWLRTKQLVLQELAVVISCGWWVAIVSLWPASSRPYIGGSQNNTLLNLVFGYNGIGRINGNETGSVHGPSFAGISPWGPTGWNRLFLADMGGGISWLIPASLIGLAVVLWFRRHEPRTDVLRASALIWGSWLIVTGLVFSYAQGIIHPYYTVVLGPAIAGLIALGAATVWQSRANVLSRILLAGVIFGTVIWAKILLDRAPGWMPWLTPTILILSMGASLGWLVWPWLAGNPLGRLTVAGGLAAILAGPSAYTLATAAQPEFGAIPAAGPSIQQTFGGFGGRPSRRFPAAPFGGGFGFAPRRGTGGFHPGQFGGPPSGGFQGGGGFFGGRGGSNGGLLEAGHPGAAIVSALKQDASRYKWVAATIGSNSAAGYQLATGDPVMSIGGFNGTDPAPTLNQFISAAQAGEIHYFIGGGSFGAGFFRGFHGFTASTGNSFGGGSTGGAISSWVASHYASTTIGGITLYDLSATASPNRPSQNGAGAA